MIRQLCAKRRVAEWSVLCQKSEGAAHAADTSGLFRVCVLFAISHSGCFVRYVSSGGLADSAQA
eukprot:9488708-Alexandrium_andersonii.AAC.1